METKIVNIDEIRPHEDNPRIIDTYKFNSLLESLKEFPDMLEARPIVVDNQGRVVAGNMRYLACKELGYSEVPVKVVELPDDKIRELMVKDNVSYGEWDYSVLEKDWNMDLFDKWLGNQSIDYSALGEYEDLDNKVNQLHDGVKKAIQIVFNESNYDAAKVLESECRAKNIYIGGLFLQVLQQTKQKYEASGVNTN
jgi:hypothetical protein